MLTKTFNLVIVELMPQHQDFGSMEIPLDWATSKTMCFEMASQTWKIFLRNYDALS